MRRKHLNDQEKLELVGLKNSGATYGELAKKYRISERRAMQIVKQSKKISQPERSDPVRAEMITEHSQSATIEQLPPQTESEIKSELPASTLEAPKNDEKKIDEILPLTDEDKKFNSVEELGAPPVSQEISQQKGSMKYDAEQWASAQAVSDFVANALDLICADRLGAPLTAKEKNLMSVHGTKALYYWLPKADDRTIATGIYLTTAGSILLIRKDRIMKALDKGKSTKSDSEKPSQNPS